MKTSSDRQQIATGMSWVFFFLFVLLAGGVPLRLNAATEYRVLGWNNLGMHCMDSDYEVFSILPPYNTIHAQVVAIDNGNHARLITGTNIVQMTYEPMADATGSINSTSVGKSTFWENSGLLFGVTPGVDEGLPVPGPETFSMPGTHGVPQDFTFETLSNWFAAYGVPITPYDDEGRPNEYPMMRFTARVGGGAVASTEVVLPVSDEMDCKLCHLSDSGPAARPLAGWVNHLSPGHDYRLNILRLHDERMAGQSVYTSALAERGMHPAGLEATVMLDDRPILCASCHLSEALPDTGYPGVRPLTQVMHAAHAHVVDPRNGLTLDGANNRVSCYVCHPGSATRCLRGAMGKAVASDGSMAMQCQSCHGNMVDVGAATRTGWLDEPTCQACHTGDALSNAGQIRYLSALETDGSLRQPLNQRFATNADTPATGFSLYRFSSGHGGLQCAACHGATHAIYPSALPSDNQVSIGIQGHAGTVAECTSCHGSQSLAHNGGPHGLHPMTSEFARDHADIVSRGGVQQCRVCHGSNDRGTVLSRVLVDRTISTKFGTRNYKRGQQISCYNCHNGVNESDPTTKGFPSASNTAAATSAGHSVSFALPVGGQSVRIITQPANGTVGVVGQTATYYPEQGFSGQDSFTFTAWNGYNDSAPATATLQVNRVDTVGDGIPDWWRALHFGGDGSTADADSCATCDPDQDRIDNAGEFLAGTDPRDGRYVLRMLPPGISAESRQLKWTSEPGVPYLIERALNLPENLWTPAASNLWGRTDSMHWEDTQVPAEPGEIYRVKVDP